MTDHEIDSEGRGTSFRAGDLLFSKLRPYLAKSWVANRDGEALGDIHVYRPVDEMCSRYLGYLLLSSFFLEQVNASTYGTKMPRANWDFIKTIEVWAPDFDTQRRIADYLDRETATIDALIEKQRRLLVVLLERRREAIRAAVFGSNEACLNADPLEALPEGWRRAKLRHVATMHTGHTPSRSKPEYWEDASIPWFTLADVWQLRPGTRKYLGETKSRISPLGLENSAAELLPKGTVVLSRTASVGFTGIMPRAMATSQDYWNWVCGPQLCPEFLWNVFRAMKSDFDSLKAGSTHKTIYQADAAALQIPLPPVQTQQAIVDHLDRETAKIDALIAKAERFIELAQERRAALITAAVTGQIEIPT
ncbi:restriction endonuclease subunit S [Micrococcus sp. FDAARGOS_333]|uniref:restriction endonuclease subunit S n=1 Tax=Micrococcus sp. FDAARGOS_333 TaxID=1930558 RepID=UPI00187D599A|nr:restriction endonuclease subunit S [Micrococcus sp. FDAARGOS_333]